jgi:hypothetical protein
MRMMRRRKEDGERWKKANYLKLVEDENRQ